MKITRRQLRNMIIQEVPKLKEAGRRNVKHDYDDLPRDDDGKIDLTINFGDPWVIGPGNDDPYVYGDEIINVPKNPIELRETKITRKQLRQIIQETLDESSWNYEADAANRAKWDQHHKWRQNNQWGYTPSEDITGNPKSDVEKEEAEETNAAGDAYWVMVDDLVTSLGQGVASKVNETEDEVYIMTGPEEGITVKVLRRGQ